MNSSDDERVVEFGTTGKFFKEVLIRLSGSYLVLVAGYHSLAAALVLL